MSRYVYIKEKNITLISDLFLCKRQEEKIENWEIIQAFIDWIVYDEVIETDIIWDVCFENWKIIKLEESIEYKKYLEQQAEEEKQRIVEKKTQILNELWSLKNQKDWLLLIDENTDEIDVKILTLKDEYKNLQEIL